MTCATKGVTVQPTSRTTAGRQTGWTVIANHDFRVFLAGRGLASLSLLMLGVAVGWHVYDLTRSAFALGMVGLVQFLPALLFALPAGLAADRFERRSILLAGYALEVFVALVLLAMSLFATARAALIFPAVALIGVGQAFINPAGQSLVPFLVRREDFPRAVAWSSSVFQVAVIAGPALGGLLYAFGPSGVYATAAGCMMISAFLISRIRVRVVIASSAGPGFEGLLTGLRFVFSRPILLGALSLDLFAVLLGGATALMPIFARDILNVGSWGMGLLRSAPAVGAAIVALVIAQRPISRKAGPLMLICVALFGGFTIVFGMSHSFTVSLAALTALGAVDMVSVVIRQTMVQVNTPNEYRGRVSSINSIFIGASNQLGEFESGATAAFFGAPLAVILGGVGTIAVVLAWTKLFPQLGKIDSLLDGKSVGRLPGRPGDV